ncbi:uncharacterized protein LOC135122414 [Zophobas morio]
MTRKKKRSEKAITDDEFLKGKSFRLVYKPHKNIIESEQTLKYELASLTPSPALMKRKYIKEDVTNDKNLKKLCVALTPRETQFALATRSRSARSNFFSARSTGVISFLRGVFSHETIDPAKICSFQRLFVEWSFFPVYAERKFFLKTLYLHAAQARLFEVLRNRKRVAWKKRKQFRRVVNERSSGLFPEVTCSVRQLMYTCEAKSADEAQLYMVTQQILKGKSNCELEKVESSKVLLQIADLQFNRDSKELDYIKSDEEHLHCKSIDCEELNKDNLALVGGASNSSLSITETYLPSDGLIKNAVQMSNNDNSVRITTTVAESHFMGGPFDCHCHSVNQSSKKKKNLPSSSDTSFSALKTLPKQPIIETVEEVVLESSFTCRVHPQSCKRPLPSRWPVHAVSTSASLQRRSLPPFPPPHNFARHHCVNQYPPNYITEKTPKRSISVEQTCFSQLPLHYQTVPIQHHFTGYYPPRPSYTLTSSCQTGRPRHILHHTKKTPEQSEAPYPLQPFFLPFRPGPPSSYFRSSHSAPSSASLNQFTGQPSLSRSSTVWCYPTPNTNAHIPSAYCPPYYPNSYLPALTPYPESRNSVLPLLPDPRFFPRPHYFYNSPYVSPSLGASTSPYFRPSNERKSQIKYGQKIHQAYKTTPQEDQPKVFQVIEEEIYSSPASKS